MQQSYQSSQKFKQLRICNCPCVLEIEQNEKIIQLLNDYTRTIEIQNLRKNQERISLQAELKKLRLELEQPYQQKHQIFQKMHYFRKLLDDQEIKLLNQQKIILIKNQQNNELTDQINNLRNQRQKIQLKSLFNADNVEKLKNKLNQMYQKFNSIDLIKKVSASSAKSSTINNNRQQDNLLNLAYIVNKKWEQYEQQMKSKFKDQKIQLQAKYLHQINQYKTQLTQFELKIIQQKNQIENILQINKKLQQNFLQKQKQSQQKLQKQLQIQKIKFSQQIKEYSLKNKKLQDEINQKQQQNKLKQSQNINLIKSFKQIQNKYQNQIYNLLMKSKQSKAVQTDEYLNEILEKVQELDIIKKQNEQLTCLLKSKTTQLAKLQGNVLIQEKTTIMLKQKLQELTINRQEAMKCLNNQSNTYLKQQKHQQSQSNLFNHQTVKQLKQQIIQLNIQLISKDRQILCLEQVNSSLKKLKIQSLEDQSKIINIKRENNQLKQIIHTKQRSFNNSVNESISKGPIKTSISRISSRVNSGCRSSVLGSTFNYQQRKGLSTSDVSCKLTDSIKTSKSIISCQSQSKPSYFQSNC